MLVRAVSFDQVILAAHIASAVVAFGVLFAYPLLMIVGMRLDPTAMPWLARMQQVLSRRLIAPGLLLVVIFGVILATELHQWSAFYVQWGVGVALVIGGLDGMFMIPRAGRLAELAERDTGPPGQGGERTATLSPEYRAVARQVLLGAVGIDVLVVLTVYFMAVHARG